MNILYEDEDYFKVLLSKKNKFLVISKLFLLHLFMSSTSTSEFSKSHCSRLVKSSKMLKYNP